MFFPYKLVVVEPHPIQYKAPLFRQLASDVRFDVTGLYAMIPDSSPQGDGFGGLAQAMAGCVQTKGGRRW